MKKTLLFIVAIFCIECGYAQTRILPLGESTTSWFANPMWRPKFCEWLTADGINYDMIGPNTDTLSDGSPVTAYDGDHAGFPGNWSGGVQYGLNLFRIAQPTNIPDIILLLEGTNDCGWKFQNGSTEGISDLIDKCAEWYPNAQIIVSSIPPLADKAYRDRGRSLGEAAANVIAFNSQLPDLCATKAAQGKNVTFVDAASSLDLTDLEPDGIHPNQSGNDKLATTFYDAVKSALALGFESDFSSWFQYGNASINENTENVLSGTKSGYFAGGGANYKVTGLTPGATYKVKAWVKAMSGTNIWVVVDKYGGAKTGARMTSESWTQSGDIEFTMGPNNTEATLAAWTGAGSAAYFDNFTIVRSNCTNCRTASAEVESSQQTESLTLKLHPNPANQEVNISLDGFEGESAVLVKLSDMSGKLFVSRQVQMAGGKKQVTLPVNHLPQGLFFVHVQGNKTTKTAKFVITK